MIPSILAALQELRTNWRARRDRAAARAELRAMTSLQLRDLGISRAEIDAYIHGRAPSGATPSSRVAPTAPFHLRLAACCGVRLDLDAAPCTAFCGAR